jgi:hypothetical protein
MGLCVLKMRTWRAFEEEARRGSRLVSLAPAALRRSPFRGHGLARLVWRAFLAQFRDSVTRDLYLDLRRLFVERTGAPVDFDFLDFLARGMDHARGASC